MTTTMARQQQIRRTAAQWASEDPVILAGEWAIESDTGRAKVGNGSATYSALPFFSDPLGAAAAAQAAAIAASVTQVNGKGPGVVTLTPGDIGADASGAAAAAAAASVPKATFTQKGDVLIGTGSGTFVNLGPGQPGQVLVPDSTQLGGLRWSRSKNPWEFHVADFGAVGNNSTDDSTAIRAAIDAAVTYAIAHAYYAVVLFDPLTYLCNTLAQRSVTSGGQNALLCLPHNPMTDQKLNLVLRGAGNGGFLMFGQTVPYRTGTVIRTTLTGLSSQTVNGVSVPPSIVGFPRYQNGTLWSNTLIHADGLCVQAPLDPGIIGYDFLRASQAALGDLTAISDGPQTGAGNVPGSNPSNGLGIGMFMPETGNNDWSYFRRFSCEGFQTGLVIAEHCTWDSAALIYCQDSIFTGGSGSLQHGYACGLNLSAEASGRHVWNIANTGGHFPLFVGRMDTETIGSNDFNDPGGTAYGVVRWFAVSRTAPQVNGAANLKIINDRMRAGTVIASGTVDGIGFPTLPASPGTITNPYFRDATVIVSGGTVSAIAVDGVTLGMTSGPVPVPSGSSITITYSSTPTLVWVVN